MSKTTEIKEGKLLLIDLMKIDVLPKYNVRVAYGDINELAAEILAHGITTPGMVKENPEKPGHFLLIRGHRRFRAAHLNLKNKLVKDVVFPAILVPENWDEVDLLLDQDVSNNGLQLNMLEKSEIVKRLSDFGLSEDLIAQKMGKSITFVRNCQFLINAPADVKKMIEEGRISPTLVITIFKKYKNYDKSIHTIRSLEEAVTNTERELEEEEKEDESEEFTVTTETSGGKKVTQKTVNQHNEVHNSVSFMKKIISQKSTKIIRHDHLELFNFLEELFAGNLEKTQLEEMFFEPDQLDGK